MAKAKAKSAKAAAPLDPSKLTPLEMFAIRTLCGDSKCDKVRDRLIERNGQVVDVTVRFSGAMNVPAGGNKLKRKAPEAATLVAAILAAVAPRSRGQVINSVTEQFAGFVNDGEEPELDPATLAAGEDLLRACTWEGEKFQNAVGVVWAVVDGAMTLVRSLR